MNKHLVIMLMLLGLVAGASFAQQASTSDEDYKISPRDQLQFQIFGEPETQVLLRVSASGEISVPLVGDFRVSGLTLREAEKAIASALIQKNLFVDVQVILALHSYAARNVAVLGQVGKPSVVEFPLEEKTLGIVDAITQAGGFTRVSKTDAVRVIRKHGATEESLVVNVAEYLENKAKTTQFMLQPGDIVFVGERTF